MHHPTRLINILVFVAATIAVAPAHASGPPVDAGFYVPVGFSLGFGPKQEVATGVDVSVVYNVGDYPKTLPMASFAGVWANYSRVRGKYGDDYDVPSMHSRTLYGAEVGSVLILPKKNMVPFGFEFGQVSESWGGDASQINRPMAGFFLTAVFVTVYHRQALGSYDAPNQFSETGVMAKLPISLANR